MFFIGIFGIETKNVELKRLAPTMCKHCRGVEAFNLFKHYHQFHFFFIPLFKWKVEYYIVCEACQLIATIPTEKGQALEMGEPVKHYHQFHFFFIPLFKWKVEYYIVCEACQLIATIPTEKGQALEMGEPVELTLWDQEIVYKPSQIKRRCHQCQEIIDPTYQYCPHCGNHL